MLTRMGDWGMVPETRAIDVDARGKGKRRFGAPHLATIPRGRADLSDFYQSWQTACDGDGGRRSRRLTFGKPMVFCETQSNRI